MGMRKLLSFSLIIDLIILDQLSKWAVTEYMIRPALNKAADSADFGAPIDLFSWYIETPSRLPFSSIEVLPFFNIVMVWNQGVSFGMFSGGAAYAPYILSAMAVLISLVFTVWLTRSRSMLQSLAIAMVIAGALGNVIDRLRFGAVIDFLDVHAFGYHWPAFNIADSAICVGVFLLIVQSFFFETPVKNATYDSTKDME